MYLTGSKRMGRFGLIAREFVGDGVSTPAGSEMIRVGPISMGPALPRPTAPAPAPQPIIQPQPIIVGPISSGPPVVQPQPISSSSPVPAGFPTNQIFVAPDGSFWEYSGTQWVNVGTPYNTGTSASVPPVTPGTAPSAPTSLTAPTVAPAPVNVSVTAPSSGYQEILDWLQEDTLGQTIGFSVPNWIVVAGAAALAWKFSQGRRRNPARRLHAYRRRSR